MKNIIKPKDVITTDKKKEIADKLEEEYSKIEMALSDFESKGEGDDECELTPVEELSARIATELAGMTEERFSDMVEGMEIDSIRRIILRIRNSSYKTAVRMLQAMLLVKGYEETALLLDLLLICEEYNDEIYEWFIDELFETEMFEWFLTDICLKNAYETPCLSVSLS